MGKIIHIRSKRQQVREIWSKSYCQPKILLATRLLGFNTFSCYDLGAGEWSSWRWWLTVLRMVADLPKDVRWPFQGWWVTILRKVFGCLGDGVWLSWGYGPPSWGRCVTVHGKVGQLPKEVADHLWVGNWHWGILESLVLHCKALQIPTYRDILESVMLHSGAIHINM